MVEAEFLVELRVSLLADPARLDRRCRRLEAGLGREVGQIVFLLAGHAPLADEPDFFAWHVCDSVERAPAGDSRALIDALVDESRRR